MVENQEENEEQKKWIHNEFGIGALLEGNRLNNCSGKAPAPPDNYGGGGDYHGGGEMFGEPHNPEPEIPGKEKVYCCKWHGTIPLDKVRWNGSTAYCPECPGILEIKYIEV